MLHESEQGAAEVPESVTSTKASGFWQSTPCSTPRSLSESSQPSDPSALLNTDLYRDALKNQLKSTLLEGKMNGRLEESLQKLVKDKQETLSATGVEAPYQEHAPPLLPFNAYYRGNFASSSWFEGGASELFRSSFKPVVRQPAENASGDQVNATVQKQVAKECAEISIEAKENAAADCESSDDDGSSSDDDLVVCPTYSDTVPLPSIGSATHSEGSCKRCCFFPKGRCNNGYDCQFCHFAHEKRKSKALKKKKKRRKKRSGNPGAVKNSQLQQAHPKALPPVIQLFGNSPHWTAPQPPTLQQRQSSQTAVAEFLPTHQPSQRPSQLMVQELQYVPATMSVPTLQGVLVASGLEHATSNWEVVPWW
jgi:hypothetical protein